jgi:small subunit ribosomal protein S17
MMAAPDRTRGVRKGRTGVVVSDAMDKTVVVVVERRERHPVYGKELRRFKKFYVHDEKNIAKKGDRVKIVETRPLSRLKRWRLVEVMGGGDAESKQAIGGTK